MDFKKLDIDDKKIFDKYNSPYKFLNCEYSFATLYMWREIYDVQFAVYNNILIVKKRDFKGRYHFMEPLGYRKENLKDILEVLINYKKQNNIHYLFKDLEESFAKKVKKLLGNGINKIKIKEDKNNFDYLYYGKNLVELSGKKFSKKKNHYNSFIKHYNYEIKEIDNDEIWDIIELSKTWYENNKSPIAYYELKGIKDIMMNIKFLNLKAMAVYVDGEIAGFTIGEKLNEHLAIIHVEKGNRNYKGIYAFVNKTFVYKYLKGVEVINRQEDLGIEGLRKSKMSYNPFKLERKYIIKIK